MFQFGLSGKWSWKLILASASVTFGLTIPGGYINGVINTPSSTIKAWCNESTHYHYDVALSQRQLDNLWSAVVSFYFFGGIVGALCGGVADRIGRKGGLVLSGFILCTSGVLAFISKPVNSVELLIFSRIIGGIGVGLVTAILPMYLTEIAPEELIGATGAIGNFGFALAVPFAQLLGFKSLLGTQDYWNYLLGAYVPCILLASTALPFLPESPKYLYAKGYKDKAIQELSSLRNEPIERLYGEFKEKERVENWSIMKVIKDGTLRDPLIITIWSMTAQQFAGITAVVNYSMKIFQDAGFSESESQFASLLGSFINAVVAVVVIYVVNLCPRRRVLISSNCSVITSLSLLTLSIVLKDAFSWMSYLAIFSVVAFTVSYGMGLGPIPFFIGSELFDIGPRSSGMALGTFGNWAAALIVSHTFLELNLLFGPYAFLLYAGQLVFLTIFITFALPETNCKYLNK